MYVLYYPQCTRLYLTASGIAVAANVIMLSAPALLLNGRTHVALLAKDVLQSCKLFAQHPVKMRS
jgi:hypothetical protein